MRHILLILGRRDDRVLCLLDAHFRRKLILVARRVHGTVHVGLTTLRYFLHDILIGTMECQFHAYFLFQLERLVVSLRQLLPQDHPIFLHGFLPVVLVLLLVQNPLQNAFTTALIEAQDPIVDDLLDAF